MIFGKILLGVRVMEKMFGFCVLCAVAVTGFAQADSDEGFNFSSFGNECNMDNGLNCPITVDF